MLCSELHIFAHNVLKHYSFAVFHRLPLEQQRKYTSVFNALYRITKEEGVLTLWRVRMIR